MQLERRVAALEQCVRSAEEHVPRALRLGTWAPAQARLAPQGNGPAPGHTPPVYAPLGEAPRLGSGNLASGAAPSPVAGGSDDGGTCPGRGDEDPFDEEQARETERLLRTLLLTQPVSPPDS